jgi:hypothetical protein
VVVDADPPYDEEPVAEMQLMRKATQFCVKLRKREGILGNVRKGQVEG